MKSLSITLVNRGKELSVKDRWRDQNPALHTVRGSPYLKPNMSTLRFAEEILLLALDEKTGKLHPMPERGLDFALAGGLLMELAFRNQIDTDITRLIVVDRSSTGDELLDEVLELLPEDDPNLTIQKGLSRVALKADALRKKLFAGLVEKKILRQEEHRFLWVLNERRYPVVDDRQEQEVRSRIREVIIEGTIPDPRDVAIICLMNACDLGHTMFSSDELEQYGARIDQVSKMDMIGQALAKAIREIQRAILEVIAYSGM